VQAPGHTMLETSGTGPTDQGSLETSHPVTGPFTPGSGFRMCHGTTTGLTQPRGFPMRQGTVDGPLTEPRSLSPSYGGLSRSHGSLLPSYGPILICCTETGVQVLSGWWPPRCLKAPRSCSPPPRPLRLPSIFSVFEDRGQYSTAAKLIGKKLE